MQQDYRIAIALRHRVDRHPFYHAGLIEHRYLLLRLLPEGFQDGLAPAV